MTRRLSRRTFLRRGGQLALATSAASFISVDQLAEQAIGAPPLRKCISLGGFVHSANHPDDYRFWGNREFIRDQSGTTWVKLWVSWYVLQEERSDDPPRSRSESWSHLATAPSGQSWIGYLDAQVRAINDDGLGCMLTIDHSYPTWANGATGVDPVGGTKPASGKIPLDLSTDGPWGWFIGFLLNRYRRDASNNPQGGHIDALEICNEPNHLLWPQEGIEQPVAQMIRSAEQLSRSWGRTPILAPATSDYPDDANIENSRGIVSTTWEPFTRAVLHELRGFHPQVKVRWSHHNYRETRFGESPRRTQRVLSMLRGLAPWQLRPDPLWLTEGGLNMSTHWQDPVDRENQARRIEASFHHTQNLRDVFMWTQHTINDKQWNSWKGGLRDDFTYEQGVGPPRPSWYVWRDLPGSRTP